MKAVLWLASASVVSAAVVSAWVGREVWLGMFAPLVVVSVTWVLTERVYRSHPENLTSMMMAAFAGKLLFFGAYVAAAIAVFDVRPVPFAASFTAYFIVLNVVEALWLKRLFADVATRRGA
jgi:hypothetical protein